MTGKSKAPREVLIDLWRRTGLSGSEIAKRAGYATPSGFYSLTHEVKQGNRKISHEAIRKLIPVMRGLGSPPVTIDELLAISDAAPDTKTEAAALSRVSSAAADVIALNSETGGALLPLRYRAERGTYARKDTPPRNFGTSRIGVSPEFPLFAQSAVVVNDEHALPTFKRGTHLHVVQYAVFKGHPMAGRAVLIAVNGPADLVEIIVGRVGRVEDDGRMVLVGKDGTEVAGEVVGVVVGAYVRL